MLLNLIRLARPRHWIKNVFVLAPVPFAVAAGAKVDLVVLATGILGFSLVNSSVYAINDVCDAAADRLHPRKRLRPVAAGLVSPPVALVEAAVLLAGGVALCLATGRPGVLLLAMIYVVLNLAYSLGVKHVALVDVFLLSSGFVIRVFLGCELVDVLASPWLVLCASALAIFLGFSKRRADLASDPECQTRPSLRGYTHAFLDQATAISAGVALLCYAIYAIESPVFEAGRQLVSLPFVAYGILNYLRLNQLADGRGGSPVEIAYSSRAMQICAGGWLAAVFWSLGMW